MLKTICITIECKDDKTLEDFTRTLEAGINMSAAAVHIEARRTGSPDVTLAITDATDEVIKAEKFNALMDMLEEEREPAFG